MDAGGAAAGSLRKPTEGEYGGDSAASKATCIFHSETGPWLRVQTTCKTRNGSSVLAPQHTQASMIGCQKISSKNEGLGDEHAPSR